MLLPALREATIICQVQYSNRRFADLQALILPEAQEDI